MKLVAAIFVVFAMLVVLEGCTTVYSGKLAASVTAKVSCYSGGELIYGGTSMGKPSWSGSGYFFQDELTGKFMEVSGNCVIQYE